MESGDETAVTAAGAGRPNALFRVLKKTVPDAVVVFDESGIIQYVNDRAELMFGYRREALVGRAVETLLLDQAKHDEAEDRHRSFGGRAPRTAGAKLEMLGVRSDGFEFPVEIGLSPAQSADERLVSVAVRDVSGRKAAGRRIRELAMIAESCSDAILTATPDGLITFWNAAAARMYGYPATAVLGSHLDTLVPDEQRASLEHALKPVRAGASVDHHEALRLTAAGAKLDVDVLLWPVLGVHAEVVGVCAVARDITELRRAQQELTALYEQQRHVALTLQHALMGSPTSVPGVQTAARYLPAMQGAGVGGDWFDLVPLGARRVGIVIGDVMGRGLEAATVMGRMRAAANALARTGMPPSRLIQALDLVAKDIPDQLVTCCYLIVDANSGELTAASAGHLPILEIMPGEESRRLPIPVSVPLGVGGVPHCQVSLPARPGSTLVLYTDGLIEAPRSDIDDQITRFEREASAVLGFTYDLPEAADQILTGLLPSTDRPLDDMTLLLARIPSAPLHSAEHTLELRPDSIARARHFITRALESWNCTDLTEDACLLGSELLTNAVRYSRTPVGLKVYLTASELTVEALDDSCNPPEQRTAGDTEEHGRGLALVDALAREWGSRHGDAGKTVWFTLERNPA